MEPHKEKLIRKCKYCGGTIQNFTFRLKMLAPPGLWYHVDGFGDTIGYHLGKPLTESEVVTRILGKYEVR